MNIDLQQLGDYSFLSVVLKQGCDTRHLFLLYNSKDEQTNGDTLKQRLEDKEANERNKDTQD